MELKPGYKQTEVGVIPTDWRVVTVEDAFNISNNLRLPLSREVREQMVGPYPYYGPTGIQGFINEYRFDGEYVLIGEDGDHFLKWEKMPMTMLVKGRFNVNNHAHALIGVKNSTAWFKYLFMHKDLTSYLTRQGASRYKLTKKVLSNLSCTLPPLPEQEAIAGALSDTDALIEALEQLITKKRHIKQGAMQELLTGKKRLPGFETKPGTQQTEVGEIPADWRVLPFNEIAFLERGKFSARPRNDPKYFGGETPFIQTGDVTNSNGFIRSASQTLNDEGVKVSKIFPAGSLFFTIAANIGDVAFAMMATACTDSLVVIKMKSCVDEFWLAHEIGRRKRDFENLATQNAQANINLEKLRPILFHFPPKKEQEAIAAVLSDMDAEISALETKLTKARHIKQGMMAELLTGRIRLI